MAIQESKLWPKALIQFNPNFAQGIEVTQLIEKGLPIHKDLERFFKTPFYKAIEAGFAAGTALETTIEDDENDTQSLRYIFQGHGR